MQNEQAQPNPGQSQPHSRTGPTASKRRIIPFVCEGCDREYEVPLEWAGRTVRCKKCDTFSVIPDGAIPTAEFENL